MKTVKLEDTLLKEYKDAELVHYVSDELWTILNADCKLEISEEAKLALRLDKIGALAKVLRAVDKRMNKDSSTSKFVV